ncbi:MAG: BcrAD BadFG protein [Ignavibacteria bacterium]|nr:BcrAD BadFG protein [Ignavibacteria bacterium]
MPKKKGEKGETIIGIDGGGTHTRGILYRRGKIIADAKSGTTRIGAVGVGESCERLLNVINDLCEKAKIESSELDAVVIGLAGVWLDEEKRRSAALLKTLARGQDIILNDLLLTSDAELALEGAFKGEQGIIIIVGTGSIAIGNIGKGKLIRCGGWGIELDDEGSGAWIGREGLTAVVRAIDGRGKPTKLTQIFTEMIPTVDLNHPRTIVKAYSERNFEYHMLSPSVMKCAVEGDKVCLDIITRACFHLLELPTTLRKQFKIKVVPVALMGGIIDAKTLLSNMINDELAKDKRFKIVKNHGTAFDGAISLGLKLIEEFDE